MYNRYKDVVKLRQWVPCIDVNERQTIPEHKWDALRSVYRCLQRVTSKSEMLYSCLDVGFISQMSGSLSHTVEEVLGLQSTNCLLPIHGIFPSFGIPLAWCLDKGRSKLSPANQPEPREAVIKGVSACHHIVTVFYNTRGYFSCSVIHLPHQVQSLSTIAERKKLTSIVVAE